jgi:hypothetical protein
MQTNYLVYIQLRIVLHGIGGMNCNEMVVFVSLSTITQMESFFLAVRGKPMIKSILMSSHFHVGIDKGWSTPADFK